MSATEWTPEYDAEFAAQLLGTHVLAAITVKNSRDDEDERHEQYHGRVISVDMDHGIVIRHSATGDEFTLPPFTSAFKPAAPGQYRLRGTGEAVVDPDWLVMWTTYPAVDDLGED